MLDAGPHAADVCPAVWSRAGNGQGLVEDVDATGGFQPSAVAGGARAILQRAKHFRTERLLEVRGQSDQHLNDKLRLFIVYVFFLLPASNAKALAVPSVPLGNFS